MHDICARRRHRWKIRGQPARKNRGSWKSSRHCENQRGRRDTEVGAEHVSERPIGCSFMPGNRPLRNTSHPLLKSVPGPAFHDSLAGWSQILHQRRPTQRIPHMDRTHRTPLDVSWTPPGPSDLHHTDEPLHLPVPVNVLSPSGNKHFCLLLFPNDTKLSELCVWKIAAHLEHSMSELPHQ